MELISFRSAFASYFPPLKAKWVAGMFFFIPTFFFHLTTLSVFLSTMNAAKYRRLWGVTWSQTCLRIDPGGSPSVFSNKSVAVVWVPFWLFLRCVPQKWAGYYRPGYWHVFFVKWKRVMSEACLIWLMVSKWWPAVFIQFQGRHSL